LQEYGSSVKRLIRGINRSAERGEGLGAVPQARHAGRDALQVEGQVWRHDRGFKNPAREWPFARSFGTERLTGALLDRLTHHVNSLGMNGDCYRLGQSRARKAQTAT
jgi:hypothetical protein